MRGMAFIHGPNIGPLLIFLVCLKYYKRIFIVNQKTHKKSSIKFCLGTLNNSYGMIYCMGKNGPHFGRVRVKDLPNGRRGKHFDLLRKILEDLTNAPTGSAVRVPLAETGGAGLANLRSAVNRATKAKGLKVETQSDEKYFYIWKS